MTNSLVCPSCFTFTTTLVIPLKLFCAVTETFEPETETREIPSPIGRFTSAVVAGA